MTESLHMPSREELFDNAIKKEAKRSKFTIKSPEISEQFWTIFDSYDDPEMERQIAAGRLALSNLFYLFMDRRPLPVGGYDSILQRILAQKTIQALMDIQDAPIDQNCSLLKQSQNFFCFVVALQQSLDAAAYSAWFAEIYEPIIIALEEILRVEGKPVQEPPKKKQRAAAKYCASSSSCTARYKISDPFCASYGVYENPQTMDGVEVVERLAESAADVEDLEEPAATEASISFSDPQAAVTGIEEIQFDTATYDGNEPSTSYDVSKTRFVELKLEAEAEQMAGNKRKYEHVVEGEQGGGLFPYTLSYSTGREDSKPNTGLPLDTDCAPNPAMPGPSSRSATPPLHTETLIEGRVKNAVAVIDSRIPAPQAHSARLIGMSPPRALPAPGPPLRAH
ncbi:hypothetical protein R3P38DRAFT_2773806 [Favolaschia claudopus]|uniref:Uncharacterized protein n=1 Tax=Favolaschia claudopus TaxID=2862362 RepID=A0AAW0C4B9_9AGAR